ncbi:glycosyltransferase, partial [candidate division GN15 bacterium]|nr:glycosyltransferase [candidate division GN15 bacterium]
MKLLVIDEEFPHPLNTGKRIRSFSLTRALAQRNDVSYLAYGDENEPAARALQEHNITPYAVSPPDRRQNGIRFYLRLLANLWSPLPYIVTSHYTARFEARLRDLIDEHKYDLVICEWTPYAIFLRSLVNVKSIIVAHNIEANIWRRYMETERNRLKRMYISLQYQKVRSFEQVCFGWANGATAVSKIEAGVISGYGVPYRVETVDNGVDVEYFQPQNGPVDPNTLVFTGSMDWLPNEDAVCFFAREVLPRIRSEVADARFWIVGRNPTPAVQRLAREHEGVEVTGTVDDVRPYIGRAKVYVVPLRIGGG